MSKVTSSNIYRNYTSVVTYKEYLKNEKPSENCILCDKSRDSIKEGSELSLARFKLTPNYFPYSFWDMKKVTHHLMAAPFRHIDSVSKLNQQEFADLNKIMVHFAGLGYDIFVRNSASSVKTIEHLHFHLIKTKETKLKVKVTYED